MATIGLDKLYYAKITEDENGKRNLRISGTVGKGDDRRFVRGTCRGNPLCR